MCVSVHIHMHTYCSRSFTNTISDESLWDSFLEYTLFFLGQLRNMRPFFFKLWSKPAQDFTLQSELALRVCVLSGLRQVGMFNGALFAASPILVIFPHCTFPYSCELFPLQLSGRWKLRLPRAAWKTSIWRCVSRFPQWTKNLIPD